MVSELPEIFILKTFGTLILVSKIISAFSFAIWRLEFSHQLMIVLIWKFNVLSTFPFLFRPAKIAKSSAKAVALRLV